MSGTGATEHTIGDAVNDAHAAHLRASGLTYREIAANQGISLVTAHRRVQRALKAVPAEAVDELRRVERERLDEMWRVAWAELHTDHFTVSHGRVVREDGMPVIDYGAKLAAAATLLRIMDRRARLEGLDEPVRAKVDVTYETTLDVQLRELIDQMAGADVGIATGRGPGPVGESPTPVAVGDGTPPDGPAPEPGDAPG